MITLRCTAEYKPQEIRHRRGQSGYSKTRRAKALYRHLLATNTTAPFDWDASITEKENKCGKENNHDYKITGELIRRTKGRSLWDKDLF